MRVEQAHTYRTILTYLGDAESEWFQLDKPYDPEPPCYEHVWDLVTLQAVHDPTSGVCLYTTWKTPLSKASEESTDEQGQPT